MPELTKLYVRIKVKNPDLFSWLKTITLSAKEGIKAIIGKLKSDPQGGTVVQAYLFMRSKGWTMEKAKKWVADHRKSLNLSIDIDSWICDEVSEEEILKFIKTTNKEVVDMDIEKGVIRYKKHPCADENTAWDAGAEVKDADVKDLKEMCAWFDSDKPDLKTSYKLPHHTKSGYKTVWRAVANAAARLPQSSIPAGDVAGVKAHLAGHYKDFDKPSPWAKKSTEEEVVVTEDIKEINYGVRFPIKFSKIYTEKSADGKEEKRFIEGLAAAPGKDRNRPAYILTDEALSNAVSDLHTNNVMFLEHNRDHAIGKMVQAKYISGKGIWIKAFISQIENEVWEKIKEGIFTGLSIGGRIKKYSQTKAENWLDVVTRVLRIELFEVSVVAIPANIKTRIWNNYISKAFELKIPIEGGDMIMSEDKNKTDKVEEDLTKEEEKEIEKQLDNEAAEEVKDDETIVDEDKEEEEKPAEEVKKPEEVKAEEKPKEAEKPVVTKTEEVKKDEKPVDGNKDFIAALKDIQTSIEEMKKALITKDVVKDMVKEVLGDLPDEVRKGIKLIEEQTEEVKKEDKPLDERINDVLSKIDKE